MSKPTPSVTSSSVFSVEDSSTVTTPSTPTVVIASPTSSPTSCVARGDGGDLGDPLLVADRRRRRQQCFGDGVCGLADALAQRDRVGARRHVAQPRLDDRLCEHRRRGGAVARHVVGLGGDRLDQLGTQVLERVLQFDLAGDGDAVVGHHWPAVRLGQHHVAAARPQRDPHSVGKLVDPGFHCPARSFVELDLLAHECPSDSN